MRELSTAKSASSKPEGCEHRSAELLGCELEISALLAVLSFREAAPGFELVCLDGFELPR
jgi:hypothetical protein